jgi:hypothetical protein
MTGRFRLAESLIQLTRNLFLDSWVPHQNLFNARSHRYQMKNLPITRAAILSVALLAAFGQRASALEVDEVVWGFDGKVVKGCFNPLSILVSNRSAEAFDGTLVLQQSVGSNEVDARLEEAVFLSPNSSRWVQFYPFVLFGYESWEQSAGRRQRFSIDEPAVGERSTVFLSDPDDFLRTGVAMKRFSDSLFPPFVGATSGLKTVVLDHVPRWEESRRRSFLNWLHGGGTVHLLQSATGEHPEFPPANERYQNLFFPLVIKSFDIDSREKLENYSLPLDRVRLFVYTHLLETMRGHLQLAERRGNDVAKTNGCVLYVHDLILEEKP